MKILKIAPGAYRTRAIWDLPTGSIVLFLGKEILDKKASTLPLFFYMLPSGKIERSYLGPGFAEEL